MKKEAIHTARPPLYQQVKEYIIGKINDSALQPGMQIESEAELVARLNVSRMTVNRALRELSVDGLLRRIQGRGTFVAERKPQAALLQISSIAEEIRTQEVVPIPARCICFRKGKSQTGGSSGDAVETIFRGIPLHYRP